MKKPRPSFRLALCLASPGLRLNRYPTATLFEVKAPGPASALISIPCSSSSSLPAEEHACPIGWPRNHCPLDETGKAHRKGSTGLLLDQCSFHFYYRDLLSARGQLFQPQRGVVHSLTSRFFLFQPPCLPTTRLPATAQILIPVPATASCLRFPSPGVIHATPSLRGRATTDFRPDSD